MPLRPMVLHEIGATTEQILVDGKAKKTMLLDVEQLWMIGDCYVSE